MKKILVLILILLIIIPYQSYATNLTPEQIRINGIQQAIESTVKISPSLGNSGSAFYFSPNLIMTNFHVVAKSDSMSKVSITRADKQCTGKVIARDELMDLAIIETDCTGTPLSFAKSSDIGQDVYVIGNPAPLIGIATSGIVSQHTNRWGFNAIVTDAQATSGNSGGAMINSAGEVIGVLMASHKDNPYLTVGVDVKDIKAFLQRSGL